MENIKLINNVESEVTQLQGAKKLKVRALDYEHIIEMVKKSIVKNAFREEKKEPVLESRKPEEERLEKPKLRIVPEAREKEESEKEYNFAYSGHKPEDVPMDKIDKINEKLGKTYKEAPKEEKKPKVEIKEEKPKEEVITKEAFEEALATKDNFSPKIINFKEKNKYINSMDGIISCTSAPHPVVLKEDIIKIGNKIYCFDLAVPRDIHKDVLSLERIIGYNIDEISKIDDNNKLLRNERMKEYEYIVNDSIKEYMNWLEVRKLSPIIKDIKENGNRVYKKRLKTYINKKKEIDESELVEKLLKSITNLYTNRAIEILKEERLKGSEKECLQIIRKIFIEEI